MVMGKYEFNLTTAMCHEEVNFSDNNLSYSLLFLKCEIGE